MTTGSGSVQLSEVTDELRAAGCVFAEDEAALLLEAAGGPADCAGLIARRVAGEPLEVVLGWAEFCGRRFAVDPGVFVPRRRSELLVRLAVARARRTAGTCRVLDLCCGSGALGAAIAAAAPNAELHAADIDPAAVRCARRNLAPYGGRVREGDLFAPLDPALRGRFDVLVVNAPYVPSAEIALMPREARDHEPRASLDGGADGVGLHRRIAAEAPRWLAPGGRLLLETGGDLSARTAAAVASSGLRPRTIRSAADSCTAVIGTRTR